MMRGGSAVNVEAREDDEEVFYGFAASEIPLPMIIKVGTLFIHRLLAVHLSNQI